MKARKDKAKADMDQKKETLPFMRRLTAVITRITVCLLCLSAFILRTDLLCCADEGADDSSDRREEIRIVDPVSQEEGFTAILYDNTNGMPTSEANDIAETRDGFIWIGSYSGLVRYDGNSFERMDSTTGITSVKCLYTDSRDRLWIGTNDNGVALMEEGQFRMIKEIDGLAASSVRAITEDREGVIYVATTAGITMIDENLKLTSMRAPALVGAFINMLRRGEDGLLYGVTNNGDVFTIKDGDLGTYISHSYFNFNGVNCIFPDPENPGHVYLEMMDGIVSYGRLERDYYLKMKTLNIEPLSQVQSFEYIDGRIWILARNGIGVLENDSFHLLDQLPLNNSVYHMITDYEGNLWFTSTRQGVMKITPNRFTDIFERYNLSEEVVNSTCLFNGDLFVGTDEGLIVLNKSGEVSSVPIEKITTASGDILEETDLLEMLDGCRIRSIIRDSRNRLWISTWRKYGLLRFDGKEVTAFTGEDGMLSDHIRAVCERQDGSVLVAVTGGVNVIEGDRIIAGYNEKDGILNTEILTVAEGKNGEILCGSDGDGIYILDGSLTTHIGTGGGLTSGAVMRIKKDPQRDIYWYVTGNSIGYLTDKYEAVTIDQFPYSNNFDLYENSRGEVWVLSSNGIYIARADDLIENKNIDPLHYTISDGLPCITTANSYSELTQEGDLYIAGTTGIAKVNVEAPYEGVGNLKAAVPYVDADGVLVYPDASGSFTIGPQVRKLTIYGYVYNYSLINPKVSYQLEGFDTVKTTVSRSDFAPVTYTNLKGGTYQFVINLLEAVTHEDKETRILIVKEKAFYENVWFFILTGLLTAFLIAFLVNRYVRRKLNQLEKKHREEAEKERIASELSMANQIQVSALPGTFPAFPDRSEFDIYASMDPAKEVGGDFYDFFLIDDDHLGLVIADVSGKGIPAALFMMNAKSIVHNCAMLGRPPAEILEKTNEAICANNSMEMFVTVWVGVLEISTGILTAANAGHEYPTVRKAGGGFEIFKDKHGFVIGGMEDMVYKEYSLTLSPGDKVFVYTDGVPEAVNMQQELYGTDRMLEALNKDPEASPEIILKNVRQAVDLFAQEAEQFDDLTMLCVEYKGLSKND